MIDYSDHIISLADRVRRHGTRGITLGPELSAAIRHTFQSADADKALRLDAHFLISEFNIPKPLSALQKAD